MEQKKSVKCSQTTCSSVVENLAVQSCHKEAIYKWGHLKYMPVVIGGYSYVMMSGGGWRIYEDIYKGLDELREATSNRFK